MSFLETVERARAFLERNGRVSLRALQREFNLDENALEELVEELVDAQRVAGREGKIVVWLGAARAVEGAGPAASRVAAPPAVPEAERRQLTVLFCDLVGSSELSQRLDPEVYRDVLQAYQSRCTEAIARYEGHIAQYLGDGLLVYFGYPQAHEDDAERALRAALDLLRDMETLNARLEVEYSLKVAVRIGVHTGPVIVGEIGGGERSEMLALGDTPNIAARLQGIAEPDSVVISHTTLRLVAGLFVTEDLGMPVLKGISERVRVHRVTQPSGGVRSRLAPANGSGLTPFVGREQELGLLLDRWEQAQEKRGQAVLISGEPGIGKSRLAHQLWQRLGETPHTALECRCSAFTRNSALYPVIELVEQGLRFADGDTSEQNFGRLERGLELAGFELAEAVPLFAALLSLRMPERYSPPDVSPQLQRQQTLEALLTWLVGMAERQPVLLVVEDLHWADPTTLEWLGLLIEQCPTAGMLILLTFRPDFSPPWPARAYLLPIALSRLNRRQARELVAGAIPGGALPDELLDPLAARADGVPLFAEELARNVVESGLLVEREGQLELKGSLSELEIPVTLQDSLMARLDRLGTAKGVAQLGAALGREFSYALLEAVAPQGATPLRKGLARLVKAELLYQRGLPPRATYTFKHALVQDTAYQSLLKSQREALHGRIARTLEERFPELATAEPEVLAHHYEQAGLVAEAITCYQRAGRRASERSANTEAIQQLSRGIELLAMLPEGSGRDRQELTLQLALGGPLQGVGGQGIPELEETCARALALCRQVGDASERFQALAGLAMFFRATDTARAIELGEEMLDLAERTGETSHLVLAHTQLGSPLFHRGELSTALDHYEQALARYDPAEHRSLAYTSGVDPGISSLVNSSWILWHLGYPARAAQQSRRAIELAREANNPFSVATALNAAATGHLRRGEPERALGPAEETMEISKERGFLNYLGFAYTERALALALSCVADAEGARRAIDKIPAGLHRARDLPPISSFWGLLADAQRKLGRIEVARDSVEIGLVISAERHTPFWDAELQRLKGEIFLQLPDRAEDDAEALFRAAIDIARDQEARSLELRAATSLARLWQRQGRRTEARALIATIYDWFTEGFDTPDLKDAKALLEELA